MAEAVQILAPLVSPNEPEATVVELHVANGDEVNEGQVICALETSKAIEEVVSEANGFIAALSIAEGSHVNAGDTICYVSAARDWVPPEPEIERAPEAPEDLLITEPARRAALELGLDLSQFTGDGIITEGHVRLAASGGPGVTDITASSSISGRSILIYGAGGHGRTLLDLLWTSKAFDPVAIVDDSAPNEDLAGVPILGGRSQLAEIRESGVALAINAVGGTEDPAGRAEVTRALLDAGFGLPSIIHPAAVIEPSAVISAGAQILAGAYIGSNARIGEGVIVNTRAIVSHDCVIETHANLAPGCVLAGHVTVGAGTLLGMGVTTYEKITIGSNVRAGNSSTLSADVPDGRRIRAGSIWSGP